MKGITFGSFDLLHWGHMRLLARIRAECHHVTVGLALDNMASTSGKPTFTHAFEARREMLLQLRSVDAVVPLDGAADGTGRVKIVQQKIDLVSSLRIEVAYMGDDWRGEYDFLTPHCRVVYLPRTPGISSTQVRERLRSG